MELLAAVSLIAAMTLFLLPVFSRVRDASGATARKAFALREAGNLAERWRRLPTPAAQELESDVVAMLPSAKVEMLSESPPVQEGGFAMTERTLVLSWEEVSGTRSVRLTWWDRPDTEATP
jgi:hypothetical protein